MNIIKNNNFFPRQSFAGLLALLLLVLGLIIAPHQSFAEEEGFQGVIINQLSTKNFSTKFNVVEDIVQSNNPKVKYILNSLLAGRIYSIKSTKQVVFALKDDKQYIAQT